MTAPVSPRTAAHIETKRIEALRRKHTKRDAAGDATPLSNGTIENAHHGDGSGDNTGDSTGDSTGVSIGAHGIGSCHNQCIQSELNSSEADLDVPRMRGGDAGEHQQGSVGVDQSADREVFDKTGNSHDFAGDHSADTGRHEVVTEPNTGRHDVLQAVASPSRK